MDVILALDERKTAAYGDGDANLTADQMRRLLVGLDLDAQELSDATERVMRTFLSALLTRQTDLVAALRGAWSDGVMTGLLLAQMREREATKA